MDDVTWTLLWRGFLIGAAIGLTLRGLRDFLES